MRSGPGLEGSGIPGKQEGAAAKLSKLKAQRQGQPGTARAAAVKGPPRQPAGGHGTGDGQSSLVTVLEEKDEIIKALRSRLTVAQQQAQQLTRVSAPAVPADGRQSGQPTTALEAQNAQLEGANLQLRQRLQESLAELHVAHEQLAVLQQLQHQLEEDVPGAAVLVDVALAQERALQDSRNDRVLQMLKSKDEVIRNFEARYAEAQSEALKYKKQLDAALQDLDNSQVRVGELVEARATLRQQLEGQEAAAVEEQGEVAALRQRDAERCLLHDRIIAQQADLASAHGEVQKLSEAVEAANVVIQELQEVVHERDGQLEQADAQIEQLQQHVSRLLGVPHNEVPSLVASAHPQQESTVDMRVAELEAANEQLEQALVHANKAGSASQGASESAEDHDDVTQLSIQLAEREGQLQAARQQVEELEAVHSLARETAIQAENRLKESLRQSAAFQQQCEALQQRLEQSEAVASQLTARVSELVLADQASRVALQEAEEALEKARHKSREMESLKQVELQAVRAAHAHVESHLQAAVAAAETKLAASQAEVAAVREELDIVKSQLAMQPLSQPGRVSSLGYQSFVSSMLEATAAVAAAGDPGLAVPHHEAAAMPHDKLLALVMALQLDLQALQGELAGARLEVAAAHQRALAANEKAFTQSQLQQLPLLDSIMQSLAGMRETSLASAENEGNAKAAELRQHHAEEMLLAAQAEAFKLKVLLQSQIQALHRQLAAAEEQVRQTEAANSAAQEACCAAQEAEAEKAAQLAVVMETLEVLQTGSAEGQQDHILAMTTELTAARGKEAALQQRCQALEAQLEAARLQVLAVQHRLDAAAASMATADMLHAEEAAALQVTKDEMRDLRTRLVEQQGLVAKVHFEVGEARRAAAVSKSAAAGLQAALKQAQDRHHQQLARERGDAAAALRSAHLSHLQATLQRPGAAADTSLEELAAQVKLVCGKQGGDGATMAMKPLFSHLQKLLVRAQKAETNSSIVSAELQSTREQHRAVEAALEVRTSEWQAALAERELLQHQLAAAGALAGVYTARQLKLEHECNTGLCEQLSCCKVQLAQLEAALQKVEVECNKHKAEASELVAKLAVAEASSATPAGTEYLRNSASMTLGLTAEHETLLGMLQAAEQRADSFSELNFKLKGTLQDLQHRLASSATARPQATAAHLQGLERHTQQQTKRLAELEQDLQQREGEAVSQGKNGQRLQAEIVLLEARLKDAQQIAALAKQRAQEELADRNVQGCEAVTRQAEAVRIQAQQAAEQAQQQAHEQVRQAQQRVEELEAQLFEEQQAKDSLHSTLTQLEQQLSEACASLDAKAAALALVTQTRPGAGRADSPSKQPGSGVAALSQRLLEASLQHVEAHKDLQIAQRLNKSLSKQLQVAERRTEQLKEALTAKAAVCNDLTKQVQQLHLQQSGPSTQSSFVCLPDLFSEEGKTNGVDLAPAAAGATAQSLSSTMQGGPWPSPTVSVSAVQLELAKREADIERLQTALGKAIDGQRGQAECFASLTKQAQHTEQELRTRLSSLANASSELAQLRAKCYAAAHEVQHGLMANFDDTASTPPNPEDLPDLARQLLVQLQEQQEVIKKLQQYATAAATSQAGAQESSRDAEEPLPPLECSQRAVIRSLTAQLADLRRQLVQLSTERDQLQDRLRLLRGSLGSGHAAEVQELIDMQEPAADVFGVLFESPGPPGSASSRPAPIAKPGRPQEDHTAGMFLLLRHHLKTLLRAQEQLASLLQQQQRSASQGHHSVVEDSAISGMLSKVAHAAAMLAAELPAMQATVQVMAVEITSLLRGQEPEVAVPVSEALPSLPLCLPPPTDSAQAEAGQALNDNTVAVEEAEERLMRARQRKDRWKKRYAELEAEFLAMKEAAGETAANLRERIGTLEQAHQQLAMQHAAAVTQLQDLQEAATQGDVDKAQLQQSLAACSCELQEAAAAARRLHSEMEAQGRQHVAVEQDLRQEVDNAKGVLAREREEHAHLVSSLRAMIASLQSSGDTESQLRSQLISLAEKVAVLTAAQEAARQEVEQKEAALASLHLDLDASKAAQSALQTGKQEAEAALAVVKQDCQSLQHLLAGTEHRLQQVEASFATRHDVLEAKFDDLACMPEPPGIASLVLGLGSLQDAAADLQDRFERMEAQAAVIIQQKHAAAVAQWARLARSQRYRSAVKQLRDGLQHDLLEAQAQCHVQAALLSELQEVATESQQQCQQLLARLEEVEAINSDKLQVLSEQHAQAINTMEQDVSAARLELQKQADLMAKAAAAAAEQRLKADMAARVNQVEERALQDITNAENQCSQLQTELVSTKTEFKRYQALKAVEVKLLEQRVLHLMRLSTAGADNASPPGRIKAGVQEPLSSHKGGDSGVQQAALANQLYDPDGGPLTAVSEIQAVCSSDGIAAALREAKLERMQREQIEKETAAMREAADQLRSRVKAAENELAILKGRLGAEAKLAKERAEALQVELGNCQQALKQAKSEGARRLRELTALQRQAEEGSRAAVPEAALEQERRSRETAEAQLREARQAVTRKTGLVKELRAKVAELEQQLVLNSPAPLQAELDACTARLKQLQASCGSKDATIRELRQRLEEHVRLAAEQGVQDERQRTRDLVQALKLDVARREAQVEGLRKNLQQVHEDLAAATSSMQDAVQERQVALDASTCRLSSATQQARQLAAVVSELLELLGVLNALLASKDAAALQQQQRQQEEKEWRQGREAQLEAAGLAQQLSSLVNLDPEDIQVLLYEPGSSRAGPEPHHGLGTGGHLQGLLGEAGHLAGQLQAELRAGSLEDEASVSLLTNILEAIKQQCQRTYGALGSGPARPQPDSIDGHRGQQHFGSGRSSSNPSSAISYLEEQLRKAAAEVAEIEERLL